MCRWARDHTHDSSVIGGEETRGREEWREGRYRGREGERELKQQLAVENIGDMLGRGLDLGSVGCISIKMALYFFLRE